jgi:glucosylceramidase
VSIC